MLTNLGSFGVLLLGLTLGYLLGSIPFGQVIASRFGVNLRDVGSGNIGATNVARALGRGWAFLVLVLDAGKAALPMALCPFLPAELRHPLLPYFLGGGAILGHCFSCFLGFRGGKGVATALGALFYLAPLAALLSVASFVVVFSLTKISSLGTLVSAGLFPLTLVLLQAPRADIVFSLLALLLILVRHRENLLRLISKKEHRF